MKKHPNHIIVTSSSTNTTQQVCKVPVIHCEKCYVGETINSFPHCHHVFYDDTLSDFGIIAALVSNIYCIPLLPLTYQKLVDDVMLYEAEVQVRIRDGK